MPIAHSKRWEGTRIKEQSTEPTISTALQLLQREGVSKEKTDHDFQGTHCNSLLYLYV